MTKARKSAGSRRRAGSFLPKTVAGRRWLTATVVLLASGAAGYFSTCILYPRPIFGTDHSIVRVVGMPIAQAEEVLTSQGFKVKVQGDQADPDIPDGSVVWQDPPADLIAPQGTTVELIRSSGPAAVPVPDIAGFDMDLAIRVLTAAGLKAGEVDSVPSAESPGVIVGTRPAAGSASSPGSTVDILVSERAQGVDVPNVVGLRQDEAVRLLEAAGFRVGRVSRADSRRGPPGTVVEQRPAAGSTASRRSRVDLVVTEVI